MFALGVLKGEPIRGKSSCSEVRRISVTVNTHAAWKVELYLPEKNGNNNEKHNITIQKQSLNKLLTPNQVTKLSVV